jgi:hypothetical protein
VTHLRFVCLFFLISSAFANQNNPLENVSTLCTHNALQHHTDEDLLVIANFFHFSLALIEKEESFSKSYYSFIRLLRNFSQESSRHTWNHETLPALSEAFNVMAKHYFEEIKTFYTWQQATTYLEKNASEKLRSLTEPIQNAGQEKIKTFCHDYFPQTESILKPISENALQQGKLFLSIGHTLEALVNNTLPLQNEADGLHPDIARFNILTRITQLSSQAAFDTFEANELVLGQVEKTSLIMQDFFTELYEKIKQELDSRNITKEKRYILFEPNGFIAEQQRQQILS